MEFQRQYRFASTMDELRLVIEAIEQDLAQSVFRTQPDECLLVLREGLTNAIRHGNRLDADKMVECLLRFDAQGVAVSIQDEGEGFTPEDVPDPLAPARMEEPGGRGIFLMRHYANNVTYNKRGNLLTLTIPANQGDAIA